MIAVLRPGTTEAQRESLCQWFRSMGLQVHVSQGTDVTILGLVGDTSKVDINLLESLSIVESVKRITEPFKNANRKFHGEDSVIDISGHRIGGGHFQVIAGPCSVEGEEQIVLIARRAKEAGATMLRGGAFKPRTSPYDFQGLHEEGMRLLSLAKRETGMPIVTEIMNIKDLPLFDDVDVIQVGARNMQNFDLLKELGHTDKVVLIKR
ncbi:MAG: 3-deoxy-7-phosphoheptulonate synthase, partial [Clostridiales bacterium]|nr:3-deoxy-7-phosphoheptulonate synthase [Clostridiales bacterium]